MKIYTKSGDQGSTGLLFGGRVAKNDPRCAAYGEIDSATSTMGLARATSNDQTVRDILLSCQRDMFTVGAELATALDNYEEYKSQFHIITEDDVTKLEALIDELAESVELPPKFIIPGASQASSAIDMARGAVRTAERAIVGMNEKNLLANKEILKYINRLADLLFMLARYEDRMLSTELVTGTRLGE